MVKAGANDHVLQALYEMPPGATGQNLRVFSMQTDDEHEHALAALWLFTIIGDYEVWADGLPVNGASRGCQFPSKGHTSLSKGPGYREVFSPLKPSPQMTQVYSATLTADPHHLGNRTDDALMIYRLYKECRNSLAHSGGRAGAVVSDWGQEVRTRAQQLHVGQSGSLEPVPSFAKDDPVKLTFTQVRCLVSVLLRIVFTIDSYILMSGDGEKETIARWRRANGTSGVTVAKAKLNSNQWLADKLREIGVPVPTPPNALLPLLKESGLIHVLI
jgi:hypothetical protein